MSGTVAVINTGSIGASLVEWARALPLDVTLLCPRGCEIAAQRNEAVRQMRGDWLLFVDSDMVPPSHALARTRDYVDIGYKVIGGVALDRRTFEVCATKTFEPTVRFKLGEIPERGVWPVLACGTGFMMIDAHVFERVREPWFTCGQLVVDCITEDTEFCLRAAEVTCIPHLACDVRVGHEVRGVLWPSDDGVARVQWEGSCYSDPVEAFA